MLLLVNERQLFSRSSAVIIWVHGSRNMAAAAAKLPPTSKVNSNFDTSLQCGHANLKYMS